eukprot:6861280-Ditylum_brightwellii.AAC.2
MLIEEDSLKGACTKHTPEKKVVALNMSVALWKSFTQHVKTTMQTFADNHECNGPALLYHLLWHYTGTAESVIRTSQVNLNALTDNLEKFGFDIANICDYATETLRTLINAGRSDKQALLKLYEALVTSPMRLSTWKSKYTKPQLPLKASPWSYLSLPPWPKPSTLSSK